MSEQFKVDCVGEECSCCSTNPSQVRVAILSRHGEYIDYMDVCWRCAAEAAAAVSMERKSYLIRKAREANEQN